MRRSTITVGGGHIAAIEHPPTHPIASSSHSATTDTWRKNSRAFNTHRATDRSRDPLTRDNSGISITHEQDTGHRQHDQNEKGDGDSPVKQNQTAKA